MSIVVGPPVSPFGRLRSMRKNRWIALLKLVLFSFVRATTFEQQGWKGTLFSTLKREMLARASSSLKSNYYPCTKAELEEKYEVVESLNSTDEYCVFLKHDSTRVMLQPKGSGVTWLAGLYRIEDISGIQVPVFTVLTREPSEEIRFIHDRMPVILPGVDIEKWIKPDSKPDEIIKEAMTDMVFEKIIA